jgi:hypothetical protein
VEQHAEREEAKQYQIFVSTLLKLLFPLRYNDVSVVVSGSVLPYEEESRLPSLTYGDVVVIEGTVEAVNRVLRGVFYYASVPSGDQAIFTVNVTDQPLLQCSSSLALSSGLGMPTYFLSPNSQSLLTPLMSPNSSLCHATSLRTNTVSKHVPIYIQAVNQAPEVILTGTSFNSSVGVSIKVPLVQVFDIDHSSGPKEFDVSGVLQLPPVSVLVSVGKGRLSYVGLRGGNCNFITLITIRILITKHAVH